MVERQMNLPNMEHFLVSNRAYDATSNAKLPLGPGNDYVAITRAMGLERVFEFRSIAEMEAGFDEAVPLLDLRQPCARFFGMLKYTSGTVDEQASQVGVPAFGDTLQLHLAPAARLLGHQAQPGTELAT